MGLLDNKLKIDLPLDPIDFHIMLAIATTPLDSYRILQFVSAQSTLEIGLQTIYSHIKVLLKTRWIERTPFIDDGTERRETFQLTNVGKFALREEVRRIEALVKHAYVIGAMDENT